MRDQKPTDLTKLRYVLYARKSTEDENRQVRSIDDQIRDCEKLAKELGLHVVDTVKETKSAKKPNQRPLFTQVLQNIEAKKYDAILCWHPDRLCRNMLEGGQIINMLDESTLADIRFHSHQFSNDANGKMLLGMLFVFSKQYSDDLSAKVSRGVKGNFSEGTSAGTPKFGYTRDEKTGLYEPNEHFELVQQAWQKRASGESLEAVTEYLIDNGYQRVTKPRKGVSRTIKPRKSTVGKMFKDPFYFGVLVQTNQNVDLRTVYDFQPMVDEDTFNQVQTLSYGRTKDKFTTKRVTFYPLHAFVYCDICKSDKHMYVGKNKSGGGHYKLTCRRDNPACTRKPKSMAASKVFNSIYERLERLGLTDTAYDRYSSELDSMTDEKLIEIKSQILSLRGGLTHVRKEIEDRVLAIGTTAKTSPIYKANEKRISELSIQLTDTEQQIAKLEAKVASPHQIKLTKAEFLNVVKTASDKMKAGSAAEKDALARILFLNVRVNNEKVADFIWREPFATRVKSLEIPPGRVGAIKVEQLDELLLSLKTYWDYSNNSAWLQDVRANQASTANGTRELAYEL